LPPAPLAHGEEVQISSLLRLQQVLVVEPLSTSATVHSRLPDS